MAIETETGVVISEGTEHDELLGRRHGDRGSSLLPSHSILPLSLGLSPPTADTPYSLIFLTQ